MIQISVIQGLDEYHLAGHLLCTDNDKDISVYSITRRFLSDVQTDVHIVPVDSDSPIRNLLKVQIVRCALVLYEGN